MRRKELELQFSICDPTLRRLWYHQQADYLVCLWEKALSQNSQAKTKGAAEETNTQALIHVHRSQSHGKGNKKKKKSIDRSLPFCNSLSWKAIKAQVHRLTWRMRQCFMYVLAKSTRSTAFSINSFLHTTFPCPWQLHKGASDKLEAGEGLAGGELHWAAQGPVSVSARGCRTPGPAADNTVIVFLWGLGLLCADYSFITPGSPAEL